MPDTSPPFVAYWYPEPYWSDPEAAVVKNLLPFFDQVAILLPDYMYGRQRAANPWLAGPLEDMGLLTILEPGRFVDAQVTARLHEIVTGLLAAGVFDDLETPSSEYGYHELSGTRLGWNADMKLSAELIDDLLKRKLALPSRDGVSIPLHPVVRTTVLVLLSQLAPSAGRARGLELLPVTASRERIRDLVAILRLPGVVSAGQVVALDSEVIGLDLSESPLEAVLAFRDEHGAAYRRYLNHPGFVGDSRPWKRGWCHATREVTWEADDASVQRSGEGPGCPAGPPGPS